MSDTTDRKVKVLLRQHALEAVGGAEKARVLDLYCGHGAMYAAVWKDCFRYLGVDKVPGDVPPMPKRWLGDNQKLLARAIEQVMPNIVDLDAYGSPWPLAVRVLRQVRGTKNLVLILTCGMRRNFAGPDRATANLLGWPSTWRTGPASLVWRFYIDIVRRFLAVGMGSRWKCVRLRRAISGNAALDAKRVTYWYAEFVST